MLNVSNFMFSTAVETLSDGLARTQGDLYLCPPSSQGQHTNTLLLKLTLQAINTAAASYAPTTIKTYEDLNILKMPS